MYRISYYLYRSNKIAATIHNNLQMVLSAETSPADPPLSSSVAASYPGQ